jgi:hypothetical protein
MGKAKNLKRTVRVYHFLPAAHALDDIEKRRIKISEVDQLNDPFELWCLSLEDSGLRERLRDYKRTMSDRFGLLCFCGGWSNPLLWSHYADKHKGMCLGFDIDNDTVKPVKYVRDRPSVGSTLIENSKALLDHLLWTKYIDWQYEEELRAWVRFDERDPLAKFYFYDFGEHLQLKEVVAGPLCDRTEIEIRDALGTMRDVDVIKARLAFRTFRVVRMGWGFDTGDGR